MRASGENTARQQPSLTHAFSKAGLSLPYRFCCSSVVDLVCWMHLFSPPARSLLGEADRHPWYQQAAWEWRMGAPAGWREVSEGQCWSPIPSMLAASFSPQSRSWLSVLGAKGASGAPVSLALLYCFWLFDNSPPHAGDDSHGGAPLKSAFKKELA